MPPRFELCWLAALGLVFAAAPAGAEPARGSAASRGQSGDSASEYWDLAASFESGHWLFVRFSISNEGPGDHTGYALGHLVLPDGRVVAFKNGRRSANWTLSEDGLLLDIGSSVLDLHDPVRRFEVDKNKQGIKVFLQFEPRRTVGRPWLSGPDRYHVDLLSAGAPVTGTIWVRDLGAKPVAVRGILSLSHTWMRRTESDLVTRRVELRSGGSPSERVAVHLVDVTSPKGARKRWLVVEEGGEVVSVSDCFELVFEGENAASTHDYPVPERLIVRGAGIQGVIEVGRSILEHDPLEVAPQPFRWLLSLSTKPRHLWLESVFELELSGRGEAPTRKISGSGAISIFFVNPLERDR